jgi:hypothetical protein
MSAALILLCLAPPPPVPSAAVPAHDFAALTPAAAGHLEGKPARYRVVLDSQPWESGPHVLYDCVSADDTDRTVWLVAGQRVEKVMDVEAVLRVIRHPRQVAEDGTVFEMSTEYRLTEARRVE